MWVWAPQCWAGSRNWLASQHHHHQYVRPQLLERVILPRRCLPSSWENGWEGFSDNLHRGWALEGQFGHPNEPANCCPPWTGQHLNTLLRSTRPTWQSVTFFVSKPKCQSQECDNFGFETKMSFSATWSCSTLTSPTTPGPCLGISFPGTCSGLPGDPGCPKRRHRSDATTLSDSCYPSPGSWDSYRNGASPTTTTNL